MAKRTLFSLSAVLLAACGASAAQESREPAPTADPPASPGAPVVVTPPAPAKPEPLPVPPSGAHVGATPYEGGVEFRVWAPNAKAVAVIGEAAGATKRRELTREPGTSATYAARVEGAKAGQHYRFAITASDGSELVRVDPRARATEAGESVVVDPRTYAWKTPSFVPPTREQAVVYELHVGSFHAPNGKASGSFASATAKLDALAELGINVVELMPVNAHGGNGWGYNPQEWFAPHPAFGSPDELRHFVDEAHARGIAVVLDVVFNHYDGWDKAPLRCFDAPCASGSNGVYFFEDEPYRATPWGPRPDFARKEVADMFVDNVFAWSTEYKVDGYRHDSVSNVRAIDGQGSVPGGVDLLRRMNSAVAKARPGSLLVAEDLKGSPTITAAETSGGLGFGTQWDGGFGWAVAGAASATADAARDLNAVRGSLLHTYNGEPFERLLYVESHDTAGNDGVRLPVRIDPADPTSLASRRRSMLAAGLLFTAPGVPMIFMGQEMLEDTKFLPDPEPLDWSKATTNAGIRTFYRDVIRLRRNVEGKSGGLLGKNIAVTHLNDGGGNKVIVYRRWSASPGEDVMVVANFGGTRYTSYDIGVPDNGTWVARVDSDARRYGSDLGRAAPTPVSTYAASRDGLPVTATIALGPYSIVVLTH